MTEQDQHRLGAGEGRHEQLVLEIGDDAPPAPMAVDGSRPTTVTAATRDGEERAAVCVASSQSSAAGNCVVAAIGVDRYAGWPHLGNAVNDARGTAAVFRGLGFEARVLIDGAATGDAIRALVTDELGKLSVNDSLVVFFAGHGATRTQVLQDGTKVKTGYIIPVDAENKEGHVSTWIRLDAWLADIARLPPKHILVILDACHSGIALDSLIRSRDIQTSGSEAEPALSRRRSRKVIVSALDNEIALDGGPKPGHSLFTGCLIEALTGGLRRDGREAASGTELGLYLQTRVTRYPSSRQTPSFGAFELDDAGELMVPLLPGIAASGPAVATEDGDVNAALRAHLSSTLAELVSPRAAIARLVSMHAPQIRVSELPAGTPVMIWTCIVVELTNRGLFVEIAAIIEAARQRSRRSRRIDWSTFSALLRPPPVPVVASWSHLALEFRDTAQADGAESTLITHGDTLLEAVVTQRWGGQQPREPLIEVTAHQVFGTTLRLLHETTHLPSPELATARWLVRIPVPRARVRTRAVTVRCAGTEAMERRYIVPHKASLFAVLLWSACTVFAGYWLFPILPILTLVPLLAAGVALGLLPTLGLELSMSAGRRSFRRLFVAWELAAPLVVLAAMLVITLPPQLMVVVTNTTKEPVALGDRGTIPEGARRSAWAWSADSWNLAPPFVECGDRRSRCSQPSPIRGVRQSAIGCVYGDCGRVTELVDDGRTAEITYPRGTRMASSLLFGARATSPQMTLTVRNAAASTVVDASKVVQNRAALELRMLPARTAYSLAFSDPATLVPQGTLDCKTGSTRIVRVEIEPAAVPDPPAEHPATVDITIGKVRSAWTGAPELARACVDEADGDAAPLTLRTAEGTLACTNGPIERVLALPLPTWASHDGSRAEAGRPASAPGSRSELWMKIGKLESRWSPTGARIARACSGRPGDVEIAGLAPGDAMTLPKDLGASKVRVRRATGSGAAVTTRCRAGDTLRAVTLDASVKDSPTFAMQQVRVDRIDRATGVTCDAPAQVFDSTRSCRLGLDRLSCTDRYQGYRGDCRYEMNGVIKPRASPERCPQPINDVERPEAEDKARRRGYTCLEIYRCVR